MRKRNISPIAPAAKKNLAKFKCRFINVVISQNKPYSDTLQKHLKKTHNKEKVNCKLWTDEHIKMLTKNLKFSNQNSNWKTSKFQFWRDSSVTGMQLFWTWWDSCLEQGWYRPEGEITSSHPFTKGRYRPQILKAIYSKDNKQNV
jgi:hypothetical protein